jgi:predicted transglutaminase-like cysteine proteinase
MFAIVRIARISILIAFCCSTAFADMHPSRRSSVVEMNEVGAAEARLLSANSSSDVVMPRLASLAPDLPARDEDPSPASEPFELLAMPKPPGEMTAKWDELQVRIIADEKAIAGCRSDESICSPAALRFLSIVELGRKGEGRARLGWINRAVNMSIKPASDWSQYGYADFWASPLQTLGSGAGDCEDYAIVKYVVLRELGIADDDLRLVIVQDDQRQTGHAIVAVRYEQQWLVLDNRTMAILNAEDVRHYRPVIALDHQGVRKIAAAAVDQITNR